MNIETLIEYLELAWERDGLFGMLRGGHYVKSEADKFIKDIEQISLSDNAMLPKRLVSLIWYIPLFLLWQQERVLVQGGDMHEYKKFMTRVNNILENLLGVP